MSVKIQAWCIDSISPDYGSGRLSIIIDMDREQKLSAIKALIRSENMSGHWEEWKQSIDEEFL